MNKFKFNKIYGLLALSFLLLFTNCKSTKTTTQNKPKVKSEISSIIEAHKKKDFNFNTLQSRLKINYRDNNRSLSPNISLRIEKDQQIWMSVKMFGITGAKIYMTPNRVSFYEKLNQRYYDGDFSAISNFLGTEVDFKKVQNLLLGQSIVDFNSQQYQSKIIDKYIEIQPKKQNSNYDVLLYLLKESLKISQFKIKQAAQQRSVEVMYPTYQTVNEQDFPKEIDITAISDSKMNKVIIDFKSVELDKKLSFPYKIPFGYKEFKY